jgi:hypothetical protein
MIAHRTIGLLKWPVHQVQLAINRQLKRSGVFDIPVHDVDCSIPVCIEYDAELAYRKFSDSP